MKKGKIKMNFSISKWSNFFCILIILSVVLNVFSKEHTNFENKSVFFQSLNNNLLTGCSSALDLFTGTPYYDNDCKTDIAIWRAGSPSEFWAIGSNQSNQIINPFGISGDLPLGGDYDGDGITDLAVYRQTELVPSTTPQAKKGKWYISHSSNPSATPTPIHFGTYPYDIPAPGKYELGVNKSNIAIYRSVKIENQVENIKVVPTFYFKPYLPSLNQWSKIELDERIISKVSKFIPVVSDYNGDGITDAAVWNTINGNWHIKYSGNNTEQMINFGLPGDIPIPGNYKNNAPNNNQSDLAVWRPSTGTWWIYHTNNGEFQNTEFGIQSDKPVPGDYDGDGFWDIAVRRPNTGEFHILGSSVGYYVVQFGLLNDVPIASPPIINWEILPVDKHNGNDCPNGTCSKYCPEEGCS